MWYCSDCDIEITKYKKNRHLKSSKHLLNKGENPYLNGKIYKIISKNENDNRIYIGSTIIPLRNRLQKHINDKKAFIDGKSYATKISSYDLLDNCDIELIEDYPCDNDNELKKREQYHIENNECINATRACFDPEYKKKYNQENRDKIREYKKKYYQENREKWKVDKEHKRCYNTQYYQENKNKEIERAKQYREKNRDKINDKKREKVICECGVSISKSGLARHRKRSVHQSYIASLNNT
jgi:hypothetical protein